MLENENTPREIGIPDISIAEKRKSYSKPRLEEIGDLRTVTLGPSVGPFESSTGDMTHHDPLEL